MSQETVDLIRRGFAAFEQGDLSQMLDLFADDLVTYRADPDGATYHGKEGFLDATADWTEGFSDWSVVPEEFIDAGDFALARVRQIARGASSRVSVEGDFWFVFEVHGTKVSKLSFYSSRDDALEAVGLSEQAMSQENVELTRRAFDAFVRRDRDAFVAFHDPTCEIQPLLAAVGGNYHGRDGVRRWLDDLYGAFPDFSIRVDEVRELGDRTLAPARVSAHGAHGMDSAAPMIDQVNWILAEIRNGRVIWWGTFRTETEALEAAGLRE